MRINRKKLVATAVVGSTVLAGVVALSTLTTATAATGAQPTGAPARIIVGYKAGTTAALSDVAAGQDAQGKARGKANGKLLRRLSTGGALIDLGTADSRTVDQVMSEYRADPDVAYVELDLVMQAQAVTPNDTDYAKQWDLFEATAGMNVPGAWDTSTGAGVTVAVIDTGYVAHSDLAAQIVPGYDFIADPTNARDGGGRDADASDPGDWAAAYECFLQPAHNSSWHGTHVAGTIAAQTHNSKGIAGIAYNAKVQPVRVLGKCGGATSDIADAITWASGGAVAGVPANPTPAKVLNLSLGGQSACSSTYQTAINGAVGRGSTVVVAAGNSNMDVANFTPANCDNTVTVASSNRTGDRSWYSNFGAKIDVTAPGGEVRLASDPAGSVTTPQNGILSTVNSSLTSPGAETYKPYMGTSMAAPHVAGVAALMVSKKSTLTPAEVENLLKANTRPLAGTCTGGCGTGLVDTTKTVNAVVGVPSGVTVANPGNKTGTVGTALTIANSASGGTAPYTWSATGLPAGLSINSTNGTISGTPTTAGTSNVTVTAADTSSPVKTGSASFTITINPAVGTCAAQTNGTDVSIPDAGAAVTSTINVSCAGTASSTSKAEVHIKHTWRGDLVIDLVAPDGTAYRLKNASSSDSADNVDQIYSVNLSTENRTGAWTLKVQDVYSYDTGFIDTWTLTL